MKVSGYVAAAVMVAGAALVPSTASAAVFTLNQCAVGACGNFQGSVTITIVDHGSNNVDFSVVNNSNGVIDYLRFGYVTAPTGNAQVTNFVEAAGSKVHEPTASFVPGTDAGIAYNVGFGFKSGVGNQFDAHEAVTFTLGSSSNFNFDESGFSSALARMVELSIGGQSVTLTSGGSTSSGQDTVPEPASIALFGLAALAFGHRMRRRPVK